MLSNDVSQKLLFARILDAAAGFHIGFCQLKAVTQAFQLLLIGEGRGGAGVLR